MLSVGASAESGDSWAAQLIGVLPAYRGERPGVLPHILQRTGQPPVCEKGCRALTVNSAIVEKSGLRDARRKGGEFDPEKGGRRMEEEELQ